MGRFPVPEVEATTAPVRPVRWRWLERMQAIALALVFLNHAAERTFGYPYIGNPSAGWPPVAERLGQLRPLSGLGVSGVAANLLRYIGWAGDVGVQLFLILSGFGLTWGLLVRGAPAHLAPPSFYLRRAARIYPMWWVAHFGYGTLAWLGGQAGSVLSVAFIMSLAGFRSTPGLFYYLSPSWWYVGLLLQLYLVYPLLWYLLRRRGPQSMLLVALAALALRAIGIFWTNAHAPLYLDLWQRGGVFVTRLPEFLTGMGLATWLYEGGERAAARLSAPLTRRMAPVIFLLGLAAGLSLAGTVVGPLLTGAGLFALLFAPLYRRERDRRGFLRLGDWIGEHSYSLYLVHHPLIVLLVPVGLGVGLPRVAAWMALAAAGAAACALLLERGTGGITAALERWHRRLGGPRLAWRVGVLALSVGCALVAAELVVRWRAPQEAMGWGERPALEPHPALGWRLVPSQTTRLRWESYDYRVTSNALGFPGPEYPVGREPASLRILTVGDAFTSAEGVDTDLSWPRLLEDLLRAEGGEVLNFGVTGYGPSQYARVVQEYVPRYRPDLVVVGFFVNDYQDALWSDDAFRHSIGFGLAPQDGWSSVLQLAHLRRVIRLRLVEPALERVRGTPRPHGYFLANLSALERANPVFGEEGRRAVREALGAIQSVAQASRAAVILLMIPAPVQVCAPEDLHYFPGHVDLADAGRYDLEQPQRVTGELAAELGWSAHDLRGVLRAEPECPYQPDNMHWTAPGHAAVAEYVAGAIRRAMNDGS